MRGNSIVRHLGESYEQIVLVSGFSKSYSSLAAFLAWPTEVKRLLKTAAPPYLYSGPSPVASLATVLGGFDVNDQRGDAIRADLWRKTAQVLDCLDRLGIHTPNRSGPPIIEVPLAHHEDIDAVGRFLFDRGIYVTLAAYPLVPKSEVGFRIQVTVLEHAGRDRPARRRARRARQTGSTSSPPRARSAPHETRAARRRGRAPSGRRRRRDRSAGRTRRSYVWLSYLGLTACSRRCISSRRLCRERPADQPDRALLADRDRDRHPPPPPGSTHRPGGSSSLGQFLFFVGDLYTYSYPKLLGVDVPFPSLGDAIYLTVYPALMAGLILLAKRRNPQRDRAALIDSLILTIGIGLLSWVFLIAPNFHLSGLSLLAKVVSAAYPLGDILLLAAAIRLAVDTGKRAPSFYLLVASIVCLLAVDSAYGYALLVDGYHHQLSFDVGWIAYYALWGAAALHPSMRTLEQPSAERRIAR